MGKTPARLGSELERIPASVVAGNLADAPTIALKPFLTRVDGRPPP